MIVGAACANLTEELRHRRRRRQSLELKRARLEERNLLKLQSLVSKIHRDTISLQIAWSEQGPVWEGGGPIPRLEVELREAGGDLVVLKARTPDALPEQAIYRFMLACESILEAPEIPVEEAAYNRHHFDAIIPGDHRREDDPRVQRELREAYLRVNERIGALISRIYDLRRSRAIAEVRSPPIDLG